jgi:hypothetical protein
MMPHRGGLAAPVARAIVPLAAVAALLLGGCRAQPASTSSVAPAAGRGTVITEEDITRMGARTAWDVVRMRAPRLTFGLDAAGRPTGVRIQEPRSVRADETPLLVVDGVQMTDLDYLRQIPATDLHEVRILNAETAQPLFGLAAAGGAIVVTTKRGT